MLELNETIVLFEEIKNKIVTWHTMCVYIKSRFKGKFKFRLKYQDWRK